MSHRHLAKSVGGRVQAHHRRRGGGGDNGGSGGEDSAGRRIQQQLLTRVAELEGGLASAQLTPAQVAAEVLSHFERSYQPAVSKLSAQIEGFGLRIQVCGMIVSIGPPCLLVRVRAEIMGAPKCRNVGESQPVPMMIDPIISTLPVAYQRAAATQPPQALIRAGCHHTAARGRGFAAALRLEAG
jgi:hypothetical protein